MFDQIMADEGSGRSGYLRSAAAVALIGGALSSWAAGAEVGANRASEFSSSFSPSAIVAAELGSVVPVLPSENAAFSCKLSSDGIDILRGLESSMTEKERSSVAAARELLSKSPYGKEIMEAGERNGLVVVARSGLLAQAGMLGLSESQSGLVAIDADAPALSAARILGHELTHGVRSRELDVPAFSPEKLSRLDPAAARESVFEEEAIAYAAEARISRELSERGLAPRLSEPPPAVRVTTSPSVFAPVTAEVVAAKAYDGAMDSGADADTAFRSAKAAFREAPNAPTMRLYAEHSFSQWKTSVTNCDVGLFSSGESRLAAAKDDFVSDYASTLAAGPSGHSLKYDWGSAERSSSSAAEAPSARSSALDRMDPAEAEGLDRLRVAWGAKSSASGREATALANAELQAARNDLDELNRPLRLAAESALRDDRSSSGPRFSAERLAEVSTERLSSLSAPRVASTLSPAAKTSSSVER